MLYVLCGCGVRESSVSSLFSGFMAVGFYLFAFGDGLGSTERSVGYVLGLARCSNRASASPGVGASAILFDVTGLAGAE